MKAASECERAIFPFTLALKIAHLQRHASIIRRDGEERVSAAATAAADRPAVAPPSLPRSLPRPAAAKKDVSTASGTPACGRVRQLSTRFCLAGGTLLCQVQPVGAGRTRSSSSVRWTDRNGPRLSAQSAPRSVFSR